MAAGVPDLSKVLKMAQEMASKIEKPENFDPNNMTGDEMNAMISGLTKQVVQQMGPDMLSGLSSSSGKNSARSMNSSRKKVPNKPPIGESKISFNDESENARENKNENKDKKVQKKEKHKRYVEIESEESEESADDPTHPRTKDMNLTLSVTLEELYKGGKKKLAIRRKKLDTDGSYEEEKKKLSISIKPGMIDEQVIRFNHMSDEKQGYETGDVVISLDVEEHNEFIRDGNNLLLERDISLSDAYNPVTYVKHLDGKTLKIVGDSFDVFGEDDDLLKKVTAAGMPILDSPGNYGDLFIRFRCVNNLNMSGENLENLKTIFPTLIKVPELGDDEVFLEKTFEMVTETDLDLLDESDSESYSESDSDSDEESDSSSGSSKNK
jgi:DnaJ-class molecular chaperone